MTSRSILLGGAFGAALVLGLAGLPGVLRADVPARVMPVPQLDAPVSGM